MPLRKKLLREARLYLILDRQVNSYPELFEIARRSAQTGVTIMQLRDKTGTAREILDSCRKLQRLLKGRALFIVNDRMDLALACGADGVHLGQEDLPPGEARRMMGAGAVIGVSCQTYPQAVLAQEEGADYLGFGSVFKTATKPQRSPLDLTLLAKVYQDMKIPVFPIGGINARNKVKLQALGIERFAVCRAVCQAPDIREAIKIMRG